MITTKIGKSVFTLKKNYQSGDICRPLDVVAHNGSVWACLEETREPPTRESLFWMHLLDGGTARIIDTELPLTGGGALADDLTLALADGAEGDTLRYLKGQWTITRGYELCEFYYFRHPTLKAGFLPAQGGLIQDASVKYPEAWEYLLSEEGRLLCVSEDEWQALTTATWATLTGGTQVGWNGIGGAPFYAPNTATGDLRLPDLRGMYAEAAGFDSLDVGGMHGDEMRELLGEASTPSNVFIDTAGAFGGSTTTINSGSTGTASRQGIRPLRFRASRVVPVGNKFAPRAWGALACVYLGRPAA